MKTGLMLNLDNLPGSALGACARRVEEIGFNGIWVPEIFGREPFVTAGELLQATRNIEVGTAIANVYVRDPAATKAAAQTLRGLHGDRFNLGLGVSNTVGNTMRGHEWLPPVEKLDRYFTAMTQWRLAFDVNGTPPTYIAAHGPKLMRFAAERADGAFVYLATSGFVREARSILGPDKELIAMMPCIVSESLDHARDVARRVVSVYADLANYQRAWRSQGFSAADYADGPSDKLLDSLIALGSLDAVRAKLAARREEGASQIIVIPLNLSSAGEPDWDVMELLAS
jgi:probable F420-dependent oxidoreductase